MDQGRFRVGFSMLGSYLRTSHTVEPEQREPDLPDAEQPGAHALQIGMLEWDLDAQLGVHRRFAFEVLLPIRTTVIDASFQDQAGATLPASFESIHHRDETIAGVGDMVVGGRTGVVLPEDVPRWTLALRTGLSFPTGKVEPDPFVLGEEGEPHQHMFFGSGTFDPVFGLDTRVAFDRWGLLGWTVIKTPLYANRHGYRGSDVVVGGVGAESGFGLKRWSFLIQPEVYFETPATWSGTSARNSGRTSLIATAGLFAMPGDGWLIHVLAKVPYYTWARGGQLQWPFIGVIGFSYTFDVVERSED